MSKRPALGYANEDGAVCRAFLEDYLGIGRTSSRVNPPTALAFVHA